MSWSAGSFTRAYGGATGCVDDASSNIGIVASTMDNRLNDLATGINSTLIKDGTNTPSANLPMGGFKHTGVGDAASRTDYGKVSQIQDGAYTWLGTSGGAANVQTFSSSPNTAAFTVGCTYRFIAGFTNTSGLTLNLNGGGAITVVREAGNGPVGLVAGDVFAGNVYTIMYGGSYITLLNPTPQWNSWTPTIASTSGSCASTSTTGKYITGVGRIVTFKLIITTTLSGGPTNFFTFTLPVTAQADLSETLAGWETVTAATNFIAGRLNSTTVAYLTRVGPVSSTAWANGTYTLYCSGTYQAA